MDEAEKWWRSRFAELAQRAYERGRYAFTEFLSPAELGYFYSAEREYSYAGTRLWGGTEEAERKMIRFGDCDYEEEFPIAALKIVPAGGKFPEPLTHRDYLGALLSLGIERSTLGDIFVSEKEAYVYCLSRIAPFLEENLLRVRHTEVKATRAETVAPVTAEKEDGYFFLSSLRADCAVAAVFRLSRTAAAAYFQAERVFVNGRVCARPSRELAPGDGVTVRGKGRFTLAEVVGESRKGRLRVRVQKDGCPFGARSE